MSDDIDHAEHDAVRADREREDAEELAADREAIPPEGIPYLLGCGYFDVHKPGTKTRRPLVGDTRPCPAHRDLSRVCAIGDAAEAEHAHNALVDRLRRATNDDIVTVRTRLRFARENVHRLRNDDVYDVEYAEGPDGAALAVILDRMTHDATAAAALIERMNRT